MRGGVLENFERNSENVATPYNAHLGRGMENGETFKAWAKTSPISLSK